MRKPCSAARGVQQRAWISRASRVRRTWEETSASRGGRRKVQGAPAQYVLARRVMDRWSAKPRAGERAGRVVAVRACLRYGTRRHVEDERRTHRRGAGVDLGGRARGVPAAAGADGKLGRGDDRLGRGDDGDALHDAVRLPGGGVRDAVVRRGRVRAGGGGGRHRLPGGHGDLQVGGLYVPRHPGGVRGRGVTRRKRSSGVSIPMSFVRRPSGACREAGFAPKETRRCDS
jgi:hypothetical protein